MEEESLLFIVRHGSEISLAVCDGHPAFAPRLRTNHSRASFLNYRERLLETMSEKKMLKRWYVSSPLASTGPLILLELVS